MSSILVQAWTVHSYGNTYYLPYTHWVYLNEIVLYYDKVTLLCPVITDSSSLVNGLVSIASFKSVSIVKLPASGNYIDSVKHFFAYYKAYSSMPNHDTVYARYPTPFGWLQKCFFKNSLRIIHYVGDPIDAARNNPNFSALRKKLLVSLFMPENAMYNWACKGAKVFTNGHHIARRLQRKGIIAKPLISSTLVENDFYFDDQKVIGNFAPKLLYVGYLRKAKGIETVVKTFDLLQKKYPLAELTIVGTGEFENYLKKLVQNKNLKNVSFKGHIDSRLILNELFRNHDFFCFASLSEGSPRVVLEAMANGINVISTPVGSLPDVFTENEDIIFAHFNDENDFFIKIDKLIDDSAKCDRIRLNAFNKAKEFTIKKFIKKIFHET